LAAEAARRGATIEELAVTLLGHQVQALGEGTPSGDRLARRRFPFISVGDSGEGGGQLAQQHDDIRRTAFADLTADEA